MKGLAQLIIIRCTPSQKLQLEVELLVGVS